MEKSFTFWELILLKIAYWQTFLIFGARR